MSILESVAETEPDEYAEIYTALGFRLSASGGRLVEHLNLEYEFHEEDFIQPFKVRAVRPATSQEIKLWELLLHYYERCRNEMNVHAADGIPRDSHE